MATQSEIARHLDISARWFRELIDKGVFERKSPGKYDLSECREAYLQHLRDKPPRVSSCEASRRLMAAKAQLAELELEEKRAKLIPAEDVAALACEIKRVTQEAILWLPAACAEAISSTLPPSEVEAIILQQIEPALEPLDKLDKYVANGETLQ